MMSSTQFVQTKRKRWWLLSCVPDIRISNWANNEALSKVNLSKKQTLFELQKNSKLAQIPEDILFLIPHHLDTASLANLTRTCRFFRHLLELTLYRHLILTSPGSKYRTACLFRTLVGRPDLIQHIRRYHGPLLATTILPPPRRTLLDRIIRNKHKSTIDPVVIPITETEAFKNAVTVFTRATNIIDLDFTDSWTWASDSELEPIKKAVSQMSLKRFYLWRCEEADQVLRDQPHLEELELVWEINGLERLKKQDLPKLRCLTAQLREAACIVPGRPIEELHLIPGFDDQDFSDQLFSKLSLSSGPIRALSAQMFSTWEGERVRETLQVIASNLPQIEHLTLSVGGPITAQVILDEIPTFRSLKTLLLLNVKLVVAKNKKHSHPEPTDF